MKIAAIIPAYNEQDTIVNVISTVKNISDIHEVIVVNDGSSDKTSLLAKKTGARVIDSEKNLGKGGAIMVGLEKTDADIIVLLDADLVGLTGEHVRKLISQVVTGDAEMCLGLFGKGRFSTDLAQKIAPWLSGQRALNRRVLENVSEMDLSRFGAEIALNRHVKKSGIKTVAVILDDLTHVMKEEKMGFIRGFIARIKMYRDIVISVFQASARN